MKNKYLPLIALVVGFVSAFLTAGVHSLFFCLVPIWAFAFGYFSSWRWGLPCGFLIFLSYTVATAIMWWGIDSPNLLYPLQYFYAFVLGGFSLLLIGALAPLVRRGVLKIGSIVVLIILAFWVVWCGYQAWPAYSYYYQVIIHSSENLDDLELYVPAGTVAGETYTELFDNPFQDPMAPLTKNYALEIVDTEHGSMVKLDINELRELDKPPPPGYGHPYVGNIIFWQPGGFRNRLIEIVLPWQRESAPHQLIKLMPRYDVVPVNYVKSQDYIGPVKVDETVVVDEFKVPIKIKSGVEAEIELRLENRTGRSEAINFAYGKSNTYTELIRYEGETGDDWVLVPVEAKSLLRIRGIGD